MGQPVTHSLVKALRRVPDFAGLDDRTLLRIVGASTNLVWPANSSVFEPGARTEGLYVVLSGKVVICEVVDGEDRVIAAVGPDGFFGEHSVLLDTQHTKRAKAVEPTELMVVPRESFQAVMADHPDLVSLLMSRIEARLATPRPPPA